MLALLSTEGKFSCLKSAENIEKVSHDKLTRFLSNFAVKSKTDIKSLPKGGQIIIDDTSLSKMYAKSIEASQRDFLLHFYMKKFNNQDVFELVA